MQELYGKNASTPRLLGWGSTVNGHIHAAFHTILIPAPRSPQLYCWSAWSKSPLAIHLVRHNARSSVIPVQLHGGPPRYTQRNNIIQITSNKYRLFRVQRLRNPTLGFPVSVVPRSATVALFTVATCDLGHEPLWALEFSVLHLQSSGYWNVQKKTLGTANKSARNIIATVTSAVTVAVFEYVPAVYHCFMPCLNEDWLLLLENQ